jgi:excisionase family DNA binding protein
MPEPKEGVTTSMENRLLTTREAATEFRVHPTTIRRWVAGGLLKAVPTPGRHGRYRESDIKAAMQTDADQPAPTQESTAPQKASPSGADTPDGL